MTWRAWLGDTMTGLITAPIDLARFTWSISVSDSSLSTVTDKNVGAEQVSSLVVPWSAVPGATAQDKAAAIAPSRRCLVLCWDTGDGGLGTPILWGAIGQRSDTYSDTTFALDSMMALLEGRFAVREGTFATGPGGTSPDRVDLTGLSFRAIASRVGRLCTSAKPGGQLPVDWDWLEEPGTHERTYKAFEIGGLSGASILTKITNVIGGPDLTFRPYPADEQHVRLKFLAGSDADVFLGQDVVHSMRVFPGGGDLDDVRVDHAGPVMRVYGTGAGTDEAQVCALSEDLTLVGLSDPWPLCEASVSFSDADTLEVLREATDARLAGNCRPLMQLSGTLDVADEHSPRPGDLWPGELVEISLDGFPTLPDGVYQMRLMEMSGDHTTKVRLTFDVADNPNW